MVSINNTAANSFILASLRQTNKEIATSQTRIGTGLKINNASDNPSVWATAQSIQSDIKKQDALSGSINLAKAKFDASVAGIDQITKLVSQVKDVVAAATAAGNTTALISSVTLAKLDSINTQIAAVIAGSTFDGANYLNSTAAVTVKVGSADSATVSITPENISSAAGGLFSLTGDITALVLGTSTNANIIALNTATVDTQLTSYQGSLSGFAEGLSSQQDFLNKLKEIKESALSSLVDANMEEESARISGLQVKQQLAYQALSIGNSSAQNILRLFQ